MDKRDHSESTRQKQYSQDTSMQSKSRKISLALSNCRKVPMNNDTVEVAIRPFTLELKNWGNIDSIRGTETSVIVYSRVETTKANGGRVYKYLEYFWLHVMMISTEIFLQIFSHSTAPKCRSLKNL